MLTRILYALLYCLGVALACVGIVWILGIFLTVPDIVAKLIYAIGAVCCLIVLIGALTGRLKPPGGPLV
jgi:hypothetical protein